MPLTLVQGSSLGAWGSTDNGATPTAGVSVTWAQARTSGNLGILVCTSDAVFTVPTGWTSAIRALDLCDMRIMYRILDNSATDTPTIDNNESTAIAWAEYSGNTATPLDKTAQGTNNTISGAQTRSTQTTTTTAQADELAVAAWYWSSNELSGQPQWSGQTNSFTEVVDVGTDKGGGLQNVGLCVAVRDLSATGTYESTASITMGADSGSEGLGGAIATFMAAAVAGGAPPIARGGAEGAIVMWDQLGII